MGIQRPHQLQTAMSMAQLLHPLASREKMLMVLASHASEGGGGTGPHGWAVAGLLASQAEWSRFEREWRKLRAQELIGGLRTWPEAILSAPLAEGRMVAVGCAIGAAAFASIPTEERKRRLWGNADDPKLFCFQHCVEDAARHLSSLPAEETVCFLLDRGDPMASAALWFYEDLKNLTVQSVRRRLGALGVESKGDLPLLRAAEALAIECYERLWIPTGDRKEPTGSELPHLHFTVLGGARPLPTPVGSIRAWSPSGPRR